ncbi:uncharacterized protein C20orf96 homolog isoform X3 [Delphinapterus leucas]|uniref:Uncharacterized protein C20orf96 homolog isoform X3 n=1 Tax=Delphinapterus leucas TaxID=9749 RepID=A0A2Y9PSB7_DELLE|nr:uncharacterized protein C20orf96 homolog isoform X3 [Delphinapterus leucas]
MARVFPKLNHAGICSTVPQFQVLDYVPWQRSKQKAKPSTLPPIPRTVNTKKSKMKTWTTVQPGLQSKPTLWMTSQPRNPLELRGGKLDSGKTQTKIRLVRTMLRNRRTAHQELCNHEDFLTKLCGELIKTIQDTDDSSALKVRVMLQQEDVFTTIADILEYSNEKKLHQMKCELQEWEEKEESKIHNLEQQVEQLDAKIEKVHKKVSFMSTYMDREYPIKSVQVANLVRQLQQVKDSQQDELDDLSEMCRMVLASMSNQIQNKKKNLLRSLVVVSSQPLWQVSRSCPQPCFFPCPLPLGPPTHPPCYPVHGRPWGQTWGPDLSFLCRKSSVLIRKRSCRRLGIAGSY